MANTFFRFKQFIIHQDNCAMKVTTDSCLFGAWLSLEIEKRKSKIGNVLDIGTGTGLLSLMFSQRNPLVHIDAVEIDNSAATQAMENVAASPWNDKIQVIHADIKDYPFSKKYDLIISNPPFYENEMKAKNQQKNVALHSHVLRFDELLLIIKNNLVQEGIFCLLLPYKRNEEFKKLFNEHELAVDQMIFLKQSVHHGYFRIIVMGTIKRMDPVITRFDEITIWNEKQEFTEAFTQFLKDYYLYL